MFLLMRFSEGAGAELERLTRRLDWQVFGICGPSVLRSYLRQERLRGEHWSRVW